MGYNNDWQTYIRPYHADDVTISYAYLYLDELRKGIVDMEPTKNVYQPASFRTEYVEGRN